VTDWSWKGEYETGNARIDFEHQVFLDLVRQFAADSDAGIAPEHLSRTASEIFKYADFHFYSEESLMLRVGYPEYRQHHALHALLLKELRGYLDSMALDATRSEEMASFLYDWFVSHTLAEDTKLADYVKAAPAN